MRAHDPCVMSYCSLEWCDARCRFIIGIDDVALLPSTDDIHVLRVNTTTRDDELHHFVWGVTVVRVIQRLLELGDEVRTDGKAAQLVAYLGDLGAFEQKAMNEFENISNTAPPRYANATGGTAGNKAGLVWRAEQLLRRLEDSLRDRSIRTVKAAVVSMRSLLGCKDPTIERAAEPEPRASVLEPFRGGIDAAPPREAATFDQAIWCNFSGGYATWLSRVIHGLLRYKDSTDGTLWAVHPLCAVSTDFAEFIVPHALYEILVGNPSIDSTPRKVFTGGVTSLFQAAHDDPNRVPADCIRCVINALNVLRTFDLTAGRKRSSAPAHDWLTVDLLLIAKVASRYSLHHAVVYYIELDWGGSQRSDSSTLGAIGESKWSSRSEYIEAIANTGDPDSIYGLNTTVDAESLVRTFEHERKWGQALALYDAAGPMGSQMTTADSDPAGVGAREVGISRALFSAGLETLRLCYTDSLETASFAAPNRARVMELQSEAAWRQSIWGEQSVGRADVGKTGAQQCSSNATIWRVLQRLHDRDSEACLNVVNEEQQAACMLLRGFKEENSSSLNPLLVLAQFLHEVREVSTVVQCVTAATFCETTSLSALNSMWAAWELRLRVANGSVDGCSTLLCGRAAMLGILTKHASAVMHDVGEKVVHRISELRVVCLKALGDHARESGLDHDCSAAVRGLESMRASSPISAPLWTDYCHIERAKNLWYQGEERMALRLALTLCGKADAAPEALALLGQWSITTKSESPLLIVDKFLLPAIERSVRVLSLSPPPLFSLAGLWLGVFGEGLTWIRTWW
jgi:hypothetical protein